MLQQILKWKFWDKNLSLILLSKSISNKFIKFLYCLENEQWLLPFIYPFFQIYFSTDSLSHLNIISSFIIYSFFNNYISSIIFLFNTLLL